jgi:hypothetical protein
MVGCTAGPLSHPAILGASASAGFGCETTTADGKPYLVDMEAVYEATVPGWHSSPLFLADAGFYTRAKEAQVEQIDAALAQSPSILIAIDYLFWSVYAWRDTAMKPDAVEQDRHDALEKALAQLDRFSGPIIVGDIPDMRAATGRMLSERNVPPPNQLGAFNERIHDWAAHRSTSGTVVVIPTSDLARAIEAHTALTTACETFPPEQAATLLQPDHLHPTTKGLTVLLREGLAELAARGVIKPDSFRTDLADIAARLPAEAVAADSRREPGLWTLLAVKGKLDEFGDAVEKKDCARAGELFDRIMEKTSRLKRSPHEYASLFVSFTLMKYRWSCGDSPEVMRRWRDRLAPAVERPLPDPWPLELWANLNESLDEEPRSIERSLRLKRENASLPKDYEETLRSAARAARYTNPAAYLELLPSWRKHLESEARIAKGIEDYWTNFAKTPQWPKYAEENYKNQLRWVADDAARREVESRKDYLMSPEAIVAGARASTLDDIAVLERAFHTTGRTDDEGTVRARLESLAGADEVRAARDRVEKAAVEAAKPPPPRNKPKT